MLKEGTPLPRMAGSGRHGATVWATYTSPVPVVRAELNFTHDTGRWQDRRWQAIPADFAHARITARLPDGARVYYFNLFDERGCVVSTEHAVCDDG